MSRRKPNHLKILEGVREDRINRNEPTPAPSEIAPAMELSDGAKLIWDRLAPDLIDKGCLSAWDVDLFTVFCDAADRYYELRSQLQSYVVPGSVNNSVVNPLLRIMKDAFETMNRIAAKFGLTPSDRAGIDVEDLDDKPRLGPERILG